ncbi:MAG: DciA family protein [Acidimicrobiales bacterium]
MVWRPLPSEPGPRQLDSSLDRISRSLGGPGATVLAAVFARWEEIVGPAVAAHSWPVSLARGVLTIGVDEPGWATQLTYLETDLRRRLDEVAGAGAVERVRVSVRPGRPPNW